MAAYRVALEEVSPGPEHNVDLPRSGHCSATLPLWHEDDVIVFGGYTEDEQKKRQAVSDVWTYSKQMRRWKKVQTVSGGGEGPRPRITTQGVVVDDHFWVLGGWDCNTPGPDGFLGDIWKLNLKTYQWFQVEVKGELQPVSRFQAVVLGTDIWVHTHRCDDHIVRIGTDKGAAEVAHVPVKGPAPPSRGLHSLTHVQTKDGGPGALFLFGGAPQRGPMFGDLWRLDLSTMSWSQLQPSGPAPHARCSHTAVRWGDHVIIMGGSYYKDAGGLQPLDDVVLYNTEENSWLAPETSSSVPKARNAASLCGLNEEQGEFLLYGGWHPFVVTYNDTWVVTPTNS